MLHALRGTTFLVILMVSTGLALASQEEVGVVRFDRPVLLNGVILQGTYLVGHLDNPFPGHPCLYVYRWRNDRPTTLVTNFHCRRVSREPVKSFRVAQQRLTDSVREIVEIQFPGMDFAHRIAG